MISHNENIQQKLDQRKAENALRVLKINDDLIDFCSNDYLGFAQEPTIHKIENELPQFGSTGSRLIRGNYQLNVEVESYLANFYKSEASLIFNSGYNANLGLFSCIAKRGDTIIYDELIHASIRDGIRLSYANSFSFNHNDLVSLEEKLKQAKGTIFVAIESIYSMDGDEAPLEEIIDLIKKYQAALIVDEAHAVGVFGEKGEGLVVKYGLEKDVFARVITFGKAFGCHGAAVLGADLLRDYLINFSRAFIYTTALPLSSIQIIKKAHQFLRDNTERIKKLHEWIAYFKSQINHHHLKIINSNSAIQCLIIPGNNEVKQLAETIQDKGFDVRPILSPTVTQGKERLRICLHTFNTKKQIDELTSQFNSPLEGRLRGVTNKSNNFYNKELKHLARKNRKETTKAEVKIWNGLLRKEQCLGYKFLRQRPILNYIVDFMCPELKLIIEIDGYSHHFEEIYDNDVKRQTEIEELGYMFIRFEDNEIMNDFNNVIRGIEIYINKITHLNPPSREENFGI